MKNTKITRAELDAAMDAAMVEARESAVGGKVLEARPAGFFTVREYADKYRVTAQSAAGQLDRLVQLGRLTKVRAYIMAGGARKPGMVYGRVKKP